MDPVSRVSASTIAGATVLAVTNIDSPSELNSRVGLTNGALCIVTQNVAGANEWTIYAFDATSAASVNSPYILAASGSGQWIALAGKYVNSPLNVTGAITSVSTVQGTRLISTIATGTAPLTVASTTQVTNLNASQLIGGTWAIPGSIGATTANAGAFTTLQMTVGDANIGFRAICTTGRLRLRGYVDAANGAVFESTNPAENAYLPLSFGASNYRFFSGAITNFLDTTDATSVTSGSITTLGGISAGLRLCLDGATGKTLRIVNGVANGSTATTLGSVGPTGSTAGNPQGWMRVDINGTDRYIPYW